MHKLSHLLAFDDLWIPFNSLEKHSTRPETSPVDDDDRVPPTLEETRRFRPVSSRVLVIYCWAQAGPLTKFRILELSGSGFVAMAKRAGFGICFRLLTAGTTLPPPTGFASSLRTVTVSNKWLQLEPHIDTLD